MNILVLLPNNVEEIEFVTPVDLWRRAGYDVTVASITKELSVVGQQKIAILADNYLGDVDLNNFEYLFLPGGSGHLLLKESALVTETIQHFVDQNKTIAAICAAPTILTPWLKDKKATCYPTLCEKLPNYVDQDVVVDLPFVTSKGAGTANKLAFEIINIISGEEVAEKFRTATIF